MTKLFIDGLSRICAYVPLDVCVLASNGSIFLLFMIFTFLSKRKSFKYFCFLIITVQTIILSHIARDFIVTLSLISSVFATVFYLLLKIPKVKKKQRAHMTAEEFVRSLDKKLKEGDVYRPQPVMQEKDIPLPILDNNLNSAKKGLNVSHARSIIEKLNFLDISTPDKLKVSEIEQALFDLEKESGASAFFKVNEKLSCLIKILAKYQV